MVCTLDYAWDIVRVLFSSLGTRVPGTNFQLDPIRGAFNIGATIRWLDFNDCFLAAECRCALIQLIDRP